MILQCPSDMPGRSSRCQDIPSNHPSPSDDPTPSLPLPIPLLHLHQSFTHPIEVFVKVLVPLRTSIEAVIEVDAECCLAVVCHG
jgi:hypothetical protein